MRRLMRVAVAATAAMLLCTGAGWSQAQTPASPAPASPAPAAPAPLPGYGSPLTLELAKRVAAAAEAEAAKNNWLMAIAIVDPSGSLVYLQRMDGTSYGSIALAQGKARTAAVFRRPTKSFFDRLLSGDSPHLVTIDGLTPIEGGIPILAEGKIVGAIGVSGGSAAQDGQVATAGAQASK